MITKERILNLTKHFDENRKFHQDEFYRLKQDEETYEFEISLSDPCGAYISHPRISVTVEGDEVTPTQLIDMHNTPMEFIRATDEASKRLLNERLEEVLTKFESQIA